jgi:hypothetical protein
MHAKFIKSLKKNTALHSDGEAKIDGAQTAFAGRGVLIRTSALSRQCVSVRLGI